MANILDAVFFAILVASLAVGIAFIVMGLFPVEAAATRAKRVEGVYENIFLGVAGIIIALLMWVALVF
jgi:hypothetical protein